jgi:hypothetical protein
MKLWRGNMSKKKRLDKVLKLLYEMPQPERSIFLHKLLIAAGIISKPANKSNDA